MLRIAFLLIFAHTIQSDQITNQFILDYVKTRPYMITAQLCWSYRDTASFLRANVNSESPKQIAISNFFKGRYLRHLSNNNLFLMNLNGCGNSWRLLGILNNTLEFRAPLKFLLLINEDSFAKLERTLANYTILPSTDMTVAKRIGDDYQIFKPYRIEETLGIIWEEYGYWNSSLLQEWLRPVPMTQRRSDFHGANLKMVTFIEFDDTWNHLEDFKLPRIDTFTKQNYPTLKGLMEMLNINFTIVRAKIYGYWDEKTKSFNGLIDMISKRKGHIAGSSPLFTHERFTVVDFIHMQNPIEIRFILKKPPLSYMTNIFTLPFQTNVWKSVFGLIGIYVIALYINLNWESKYFQKINNNQDKVSSSDCTLMIFETICQQGSETDSKTFSGRVLMMFMLVSFTFLYYSYSAFIIVLLQSTHTIADYQEIIDSAMTAGGQETSYMRIYMAKSKNPLQNDLYQKKVGPNGFFTLEEGMAKVQKGFFAFHAEVAPTYDYVVEKFTDYEVCNLQFMGGYMEYMKGYTSVPKNSPYKDIFKVGLMKLEEYGIQRRNYLRFIRMPKCYSGGGSFQSVGIKESYNTLLIWAYGMALAVIFLFIEIFRGKMKRYPKDPKKHDFVHIRRI